MEPPPLPPPTPPECPPAISRTGWWMHLAVLGSYPIVLGIIGHTLKGERTGPILPRDASGLLVMGAVELGIFAVFFLIAWAGSRVTHEQLLLRWRGGVTPVLWGVVYSVALRIGVGIVMAVVFVAGFVLKGVKPEELAEQMRPQTEQLIDARALSDPVYFALSLTFLSFVVAGLREELWRAGVLAALLALFPRLNTDLKGRLVTVGIVALIFGLGHLPQGWGGVAATTVLGFGLGAIIVWHRSIWEAVLAHGFFDATTFALLVALAKLRPDLLPGG
ncbi:MAG: CPBP family intramembrane glutamic endopeptidase [Verrucomicrobiota bacterium]